MSKPVGNFDCARLMTVQVKIGQRWANAQSEKVDGAPAKVEVLNAMIANQTVDFPEMKSTDKDLEVKIVWLTDCGEHAEQDCDDVCEVGGNEIESDCKTYTLDECTKDGFSIPEEKFRTSIYSPEDVVAKAMDSTMKRMEVRYARASFGKLITGKGVNQHEADPFTIDGGGDTFVPPSRIDADLMLDVIEMAQMNEMDDPFLISGSMLNKQKLKFQYEATNLIDGASNKAKLSAIPMYNDLWNVDSVLGQKGMVLVNKNAYAIVSKNRYTSTPVEKSAGMWTFTVASKRVAGLVFDVVYTMKCENDDWTHHYSLYIRWDLFFNPLPCNAEKTGILPIFCGVAA